MTYNLWACQFHATSQLGYSGYPQTAYHLDPAINKLTVSALKMIAIVMNAFQSFPQLVF